VGIDLVAMSVNDVAVTGAEPLFFLDYFAAGKLDVDVAEKVIGGVADGCRQAGCALLGGETAELPGMYPAGEYDLAGFCVGVVEKADVKDGRTLAVGDVVLGLGSSGLHSNGHSLARKVVLEVLGLGFADRPALLGGASVADVLMTPTRIYVAGLAALSRAGVGWKAAAHITGGGLIENPPRVLRDEALALRFDASGWTLPPVFQLIASAGIAPLEMQRTFNLGVGMIVVVPPAEVDAALRALRGAGETAFRCGEVIARRGGPVEIVGEPSWSV
jgi:phosphoribosylformylglycinamidine cyclo-ligase